jgi:phenylpyruvate tautomerase PptA (4-oxalocrotonate tautomerase family)
MDVPYYRGQAGQPEVENMPLVRIDLMEGKPRLQESPRRWCLPGAPRSGRRPRERSVRGRLRTWKRWFGVLVFIQITLTEGRSLESEKDLYSKIAELLREKPGVRPEDLVNNLVEVSKANWSYGYGEAQSVS